MFNGVHTDMIEGAFSLKNMFFSDCDWGNGNYKRGVTRQVILELITSQTADNSQKEFCR